MINLRASFPSPDMENITSTNQLKREKIRDEVLQLKSIISSVESFIDIVDVDLNINMNFGEKPTYTIKVNDENIELYQASSIKHQIEDLIDRNGWFQ